MVMSKETEGQIKDVMPTARNIKSFLKKTPIFRSLETFSPFQDKKSREDILYYSLCIDDGKILKIVYSQDHFLAKTTLQAIDSEGIYRVGECLK